MVGSEGKGARPGMLRGGRDARGGTEEPEGGRKTFQSPSESCHMVLSQRKGRLPVDPIGNDTELRSGRGRLRLGRLGRGGKPPARGIRPITHTRTTQCKG